jgi:hypothetical protein
MEQGIQLGFVKTSEFQERRFEPPKPLWYTTAIDRDFHTLLSVCISKLNHSCVKTTQLECKAVRIWFIYTDKFQIMWPVRIVG